MAVVALLGLSAAADTADAGRRNSSAPSSGGNGVWQKGYGWAGYGWYNIYGGYVGYDGYSTTRAGYPRIYGSPSNFRPRFPDSVYDRAPDGYKY
jgi:hypothetical protein